MRLVGLALLALSAIGLLILVSDWLAAAECMRNVEDLMRLQCSGPRPWYLFLACVYFGLLGAFLAFRRPAA